MLTEQPNPKTQNLDQLPTLEMVRLINEEDRLVAEAITQALPEIAAAIDATAERLKKGGRLIYIGAGTSGRLGVLDASEAIPTFSVTPDLIQGIIAGGEAALTHALEGVEDDRQAVRDDLNAVQLTAQDVVFGLAASGRTPYVLSGVAFAKECGALTIGLACNKPAPLLEAVDIAIGVPVGPEVLAGSTRMKAGTAQKMVLNMVSTGTMVKLGKVYTNLMVDVQVKNEKLAQRATGIIAQITGLDETAAAALLRRANNQVKVAIVMHKRGIDYNEALEKLQAADGYLREVIE